MNKPRVLIFTDIPSPYQVELFNSLSEDKSVHLTVIYIREKDNLRNWKTQNINHEHFYLNDENKEKIENYLIQRDLVIFCLYRNSSIQGLIKKRNNSGKPWAFWGERPGYKIPLKLGKFYRYFRLNQLHSSNAPIWGIGQLAIDTYKNEFGMTRKYINMPYYSNLGRFKKYKGSKFNKDKLVILFSGVLSKRKGVDLLLKSFDSISKKYGSIYLDLIGDGPLRSLVKKYENKNPKIRWHGFQSWEVLPSFYHTADILCVPSRYDGWGLVISEGMAAGLPVIATDRMGAAHDMIQQGKNGWKIKAGSLNGLVNILIEVIMLDEKQYSLMSGYAYETAKKYNVEAGVSNFNNAVQTTLQAWND